MGIEAKSVKQIEIEQQIRFGFTPEVCKALEEWSVVDKFCWALHDKDTEPDGYHCDIMLKFKDSVPTQAIVNKVNKLAGCESIGFEQLEKIKSGWDNAVAYIGHWNAPDKHRYDISEIHCNFDYEALANKAISPIKDKYLLDLIDKIESGELKRYNYMDYMTVQQFVAYNSRLNKAWTYYEEKKIRELKHSSIDMDVIYIAGDPESYKTTFAKMICEKKGFEFCVSSSSNDPFQDYKGEEALILDDLRPDALCISDLLKVLDHHTRSSSSSRFYNKFLFTKLIIITSVMEIEAFFKDLSQDKPEPKKQLFRRCNIYIKMRKKNIDIYQYSSDSGLYNYVCTLENKISNIFPLVTPDQNSKKQIQDFFAAAVGASPRDSPVPFDMVKIDDTVEIPECFK